ncbi:unnamed protein product [Clonostachys byssicola]|uniref:Glucose-methanol-choline oxidoreductase N-terminal domain-containing protein n=1 Tax=Clonostachys byssicola TaxID=160290 RepID=A0A9N9U8Y7_9HYPO|nr:unnamed protein product [Clonostachys byssicola]
MYLTKAFCVGASILSVVEASTSRARAFTKRHAASSEEYDFVVVGGGTAGLTVAHRVSAAFPQKSILVIEYGKIEGTVGYFDPPEDGRGASRLVINSPPVASVNNRSATVMLGMTVGGGSAVNGQFLDRGSRYDYDEWTRLGSPEFDNTTDIWDWENFGPAFGKASAIPWLSSRRNPLPMQILILTSICYDELAGQYGYTWDASYYPGDSIQASFPPFQWPVQNVGWKAYEELGLDTPVSCDNGNKHGTCWVPTAQNSETVERSHAGVGHYTRVVDSLPNLHLLVEHKVTRLIIDRDNDAPPTVQFRPVAGGEVQTIRPKHEVILSAGAIHTPQILQRSGVASAEYLKSEGIDPVEDLPGVGQNFQDHCGTPLAWSYDEPSPREGDITNNATYAAEAVAQFRERPARGPYTLAMGNSAAYVALKHVNPQWKQIVADIRAQIDDRSALGYLTPTAAESVQEGYLAQLEIIAQALEHSEHPILEMPFHTGPAIAFLLKPLSRGSVVLNSDDHDATPIVNYATGANPIDLEIMVTYVDYFRRIYATNTWQELGAVEVAPGANVTAHDALIEYVKDNVVQSLMHPCCTAAMLPREKGGVVDSGLSVYGISGLRVADCSIIPTIPAAHTTTTAYAIGEKNSLEIFQPILTQHLSHLLLTPPLPCHRDSQLGPVGQRTERLHNLLAPPWGELPRIPLVLVTPCHEVARTSVALARVGADADEILSREADDIVEGIYIVVDGAVVALCHVRTKLAEADETTLGGDQLDQAVVLVPRMLLQSSRKHVRETRWLALWSIVDDIFTGLRSDMAEIADNPELGHLIHHLSSEPGQPRVPQLRVPGAAVVLRVVRQLHLADTQIAEDAQVGQLVLDARCVLPAEQYGGAA